MIQRSAPVAHYVRIGDVLIHLIWSLLRWRRTHVGDTARALVWRPLICPIAISHTARAVTNTRSQIRTCVNSAAGTVRLVPKSEVRKETNARKKKGEYFVSPLNRLTLMINGSYEPLGVISARRALTMIFKGVAILEQASPYVVRTPQISVPVPDVIRLVRYRRVPRQTRSVSRKGIFLRDSMTCMYCHKKFAVGDLTLDHVVPRARGGPSSWDNMVAACRPCNHKKNDRTPQEAGMPLLKEPRQISIHARHKLLQGDRVAWDRYLFS